MNIIISISIIIIIIIISGKPADFNIIQLVFFVCFFSFLRIYFLLSKNIITKSNVVAPSLILNDT